MMAVWARTKVTYSEGSMLYGIGGWYIAAGRQNYGFLVEKVFVLVWCKWSYDWVVIGFWRGHQLPYADGR